MFNNNIYKNDILFNFNLVKNRKYFYANRMISTYSVQSVSDIISTL